MVCLLTRVVVVVVVVALVVLIVAQREGVFRDEPRGALHAQRERVSYIRDIMHKRHHIQETSYIRDTYKRHHIQEKSLIRDIIYNMVRKNKRFA